MDTVDREEVVHRFKDLCRDIVAECSGDLKNFKKRAIYFYEDFGHNDEYRPKRCFVIVQNGLLQFVLDENDSQIYLTSESVVEVINDLAGSWLVEEGVVWEDVIKNLSNYLLHVRVVKKLCLVETSEVDSKSFFEGKTSEEIRQLFALLMEYGFKKAFCRIIPHIPKWWVEAKGGTWSWGLLRDLRRSGWNEEVQRLTDSESFRGVALS